jgi:hypothetical protein
MVDNLTAKKLELEATLAKMTEEAIITAAGIQEVKVNIEKQVQKENTRSSLFSWWSSKPTAPETQATNICKYLENSQCATDEKQKLYLQSILGNKNSVTTIRYRGS